MTAPHKVPGLPVDVLVAVLTHVLCSDTTDQLYLANGLVRVSFDLPEDAFTQLCLWADKFDIAARREGREVVDWTALPLPPVPAMPSDEALVPA